MNDSINLLRLLWGTQTLLFDIVLYSDKIVYNKNILTIQDRTFPSQQDLLLLAHRVKVR